ncbi:membrane protein [Pseudoxanthomonas dokdonensis]|uniref:undecaprenyl-diphosphate phosphatase n=1 Tax=Pseudoxanthomonas dokdonensis TaxID=344882 RepID=A0A0R0CLJ6_9GAMM|nr:membrane protein [Pseudoxanthomonas dokdonensis]
MSPADTLAQGARVIIALFRRHPARIALLFIGLLLPLWLFAELADEVHELEDFYFDAPLLHGARAIAGPWLDRLFVGISALGYQYGVIPADVLVVLVLLARRYWRRAGFAAAAFIGSALLNIASKQFFQRDRPSLWESIAPETTYSFPSGHAMGSMTLAMVLILLAWPTRWRWWVMIAALGFTVLVGLSRVYLGVHYPSDILAGWAAGMAWVVGLYLALFTPKRNTLPSS